MSRINSRRKGRAFEQAIARDIRHWLSDPCPDCRGLVPACLECDGTGRVSDWTVVRNEPRYQCGLDNRAGEFNIIGPFEHPISWECKDEKAFKLAHLFRSPLVGPVEDYWAQAVRQAGSVQRHPILVCKQSRQPPIALMRPVTSRHLVWMAHRPMARIDVSVDALEWETVVIWRWETLLQVPSIRLMEIGR